MKKCLFYFLFTFITSQVFSQEIVNFVMVGAQGVTEDAEKATGFVAVKQYKDLHFERLDYKKGGPLVKVRSYNDQDLKILNGRYLDYASDGSLRTFGYYVDNLKDGKWWTYNDTGKVITEVRYAKDSIIEVVDLSVERVFTEYGDEREATFPGGAKAWMKYLRKELERDNPANKSFNGGKVIINFSVGQDGTIEETFVSKSVEFILDETSLKIIANGPKWNAAFQNGHNVRAYRRQPLTFVKN